jgi:hypothetical protein
MALRPVSDLGLVDLTDLASPGESATPPRKARQPGGAQRARPAGEATRASRSAPKQRRSATPQKAAGPTSRTATRHARSKAASAVRTGMVVASWTVAGACGVLLGRAAVRR